MANATIQDIESSLKRSLNVSLISISLNSFLVYDKLLAPLWFTQPAHELSLQRCLEMAIVRRKMNEDDNDGLKLARKEKTLHFSLPQFGEDLDFYLECELNHGGHSEMILFPSLLRISNR